MLWQRVLTALVLIPLVVAGILKLDTVAFALVLGAFVMLGALEMARLAQLHQRPAQVLFAVGTALALGLAWHFLHGAALQAVQWAMALWWAVTTVMLFSRRRELRRIEGSRPLILVLGALVLREPVGVHRWAAIAIGFVDVPITQRLADFEPLLEVPQSLIEPPQQQIGMSQQVVRDRDVSLKPQVVGFLVGEPLGDLQGSLVEHPSQLDRRLLLVT